MRYLRRELLKSDPGLSGGGSGGRANPEYRGAAIATLAARGRAPVLHGDPLCFLDVSTFPTLQTVTGHRKAPSGPDWLSFTPGQEKS